MMRLNPHLTFNGQCEAAFKFYEQCLGGKIVMLLTYRDSPMAEEIPPDWRNKIIHATFALGDHVLQGADAPPERYQKPQGFSVVLNLGDAARADRIFKTLAENGTVQIPIQGSFWALRFGLLVDQFGTPWMINCGKPASDVRGNMMKCRGKVVLLFCLVLGGSISQAADVPQLSADAGPCWAEFTVTDAARKPVYLAKITTVVRFGFMSKRKTDLELSTDFNGKGKFTGLPHDVKKPLAFTITYQDQSKTVTHDPATNCHAAFDVALDGKTAK